MQYTNYKIERKLSEPNASPSNVTTLGKPYPRKVETTKYSGKDSQGSGNEKKSIEELIQVNKRLTDALGAAEGKASANAILFSTEIERLNRQLSEKQKELDDISKFIDEIARKQTNYTSYRSRSPYLQKDTPTNTGGLTESVSKISSGQSVLKKLQEVFVNFASEREQNLKEIEELRKKLNLPSKAGDLSPKSPTVSNESVNRRFPYYSPIRSTQHGEQSSPSRTTSPLQSFVDKGSGVGSTSLKGTIATQSSDFDKNPGQQTIAKYPQKSPVSQYTTNYNPPQSKTPKESTLKPQYQERFQFSRTEVPIANQRDTSAPHKPHSFVNTSPQKGGYTLSEYSDRNNRFRTPDSLLHREQPKTSYSPTTQRQESSNVTRKSSPQQSQPSATQTPNEAYIKRLQAELNRLESLLQEKDKEINKLTVSLKSPPIVNELTENLREIRVKNQTLLKQIDSLQREIVDLTVSERDLKAEIAKLKAKIMLDEENRKFEGSNRITDDVMNKLRIQNEELEASCYYLTKENERLKNVVEHRDNEITKLLSGNNALSDEIKTLHSNIIENEKKHQQELSALRQRMDITKDGDLYQQIAKLRGEHQSEIKRLRDEVQYNLMKSIEKDGKIREMSDLVERLTKDLKDRETQLDEFNEKFSNVEQTRDSYGSRMEREAEKWRKKYEQLEQSSQQKIDEMMQSFETFRSKDKDTLRKEIERLTAENIRLKESLEFYKENEFESGTQYEAKINELNLKIERILSEKKKLEGKDTEQQQGDRQVLENQISSLEEREGELEQIISEMKSANAKFSEELMKAKREKQALVDKCKSLEEEKEILENKVTMLKAEKEKINKERHDILNEMGSLEQVVEQNHIEMEKKISALTKENHELRDEITSLEDTLNLQQRETAQALSEQAKGFEREKQRFNELKQKFEELKRQKEIEVQELRKQLEDESRRVFELEKGSNNEKGGLEGSLKELTKKLKALEEENHILSDQCEQQGREIDQLREDLDKAEEERDIALDQLQSQFDLFTRTSIGVNDLEVRYKVEKSSLETQIAELQRKLANAEESNFSLEKEIQRLRVQIAASGNLELKQKEMQDKIEELDRAKKKYDEAITSLDMNPVISMLKSRESLRSSGGRMNSDRKSAKSGEDQSDVAKD